MEGMIFVFDETENCGKRRKVWLPAFSSYPTMLQKPSSGSLLT